MEDSLWKKLETKPEGLELLLALGLRTISKDDIEMVSHMLKVRDYIEKDEQERALSELNVARQLVEINPQAREEGLRYLDGLKDRLYGIYGKTDVVGYK